MTTEKVTWLDEAGIEAAIAANHAVNDPGRVREILARAETLVGLSEADVAALCGVTDAELLEEMFAAARRVKTEIYGPRIVLFAPLYFSNICLNECVYCAFRRSNHELDRKILTMDEIEAETAALIDQGHKRLLLIGGEAFPKTGFQYLLDAIERIYSVKRGRGEIRRINVNVAPLSTDEFKQLKDAKIGTYQLFQETYNRKVYETMHPSGAKADFDWRVSVMDRAMAAGIDDVGIGPLLGLHDWRFEVLATMQQAGTVASIGNAASFNIDTTVFPFILRGVSLLGVDSGYIGFPTRQRVWDRLATDLKPRHLAAITRTIEFDALPGAFDDFIHGRVKGRTVVRIGA